MKALGHPKFMDVCDEKATGKDGSVPQRGARGLVYHVASEICFQPFPPRCTFEVRP